MKSWICFVLILTRTFLYSHFPRVIGWVIVTRPHKTTPVTSTRRDLTLSLPEENPILYQTPLHSLSGVKYSTVLSGIHQLYPPYQLQQRNSKSRTDGYWAYEKQGRVPPSHFTYGEFDFGFFAIIMDRAWIHFNTNHTQGGGSCCCCWENKVFVDIGSGCGRLVFSAAALHPQLQSCRGLEILQNIHEVAVENYGKTRKMNPPPWNNTKEEDNIVEENVNIDQDAIDNKDEYYAIKDPLSMANIQLLQNVSLDEWKEILANCDVGSWDADTIDEELYDQLEEKEDEEDGRNLTDITNSITPEPSTRRSDPDDLTAHFFSTVLDFLITDIEQENDPEDMNVPIADPIMSFRSFSDMNSLPQNVWDEMLGEISSTDTSIFDTLNITRSILQKLKQQDPIQDASSMGMDPQKSPIKWNEKDHVLHCLQPDNMTIALPVAPIQFTCGSFEDPYEFLADIDVAFVFSSCMSSSLMDQLGKALGRQCKPGSVIITTEFPLPLEGTIEPLEDDPTMPYGHYRMELVEVMDGYCWIVGGNSTVYIHRVVESLGKWYGTEKRIQPKVSYPQQAYRVIQAYEQNTLTNTTTFVRNVKNALAFFGFLDELTFSNL